MKLINTPDKKFNDGLPHKAVLATRVTAEWLNSLQDEIANAIGLANIDATKNDQLLTAIKGLIKSGGTSTSGSSISALDQTKIDASYTKIKTLVETALGHTIDDNSQIQLIDAVKKIVDDKITASGGGVDLAPLNTKTAQNATDIASSLTLINKNISDISALKTTGGGTTVVDASETVKGIAEIATQSETDTGTDDTRIVTPKKLSKIRADITALKNAKTGGGTTAIVNASENNKGIIEIANQAETDAGTDDKRAITPLKLSTIRQRITKLDTDVKIKNTAQDSEITALKQAKIGDLAKIQAEIKKLQGAEVADVADLQTKIDATTSDVTDLKQTDADNLVLINKNISDINTLKATGGGGTGTATVVDASETAKGIAEIATQQETDARLDDTKIVTPKKLSTINQTFTALETNMRQELDALKSIDNDHIVKIDKNTTDVNTATADIFKLKTKNANQDVEIDRLKNVELGDVATIKKSIADLQKSEVADVAKLQVSIDKNITDLADIKKKNFLITSL